MRRKENINEGIKHIEDLKPQELLDFLSNWNIDKKNFRVSEKVDGNFLGFGLKDGQFFVSSKNKEWYSPDEISNLFFLQSFKDYFRYLQKIPLYEIVQKIALKYNILFNGNIKIEGEAIPSYDHNIVIYDKKKIGDGIFVIFGTVIDGQKFNNQRFWSDLAEEMNKYTDIKIYAVPEVNLSNLEFDNTLIVSLENLIKKYGNFLKKPARKPEEKELKEKLLSIVKKVGMSAKQQALQTKFNSLFGDEYEGLVIAAPGGDLVKIVDKGKFTERKKSNWHFIDKLIQVQNNFKNKIKNNPNDIKKALVRWQRELNSIEKDYNKNKDKFITIPKKGYDTEQSIKLDNNMIKTMENMLGELKPTEVVSKYFNKEIVPEFNQHDGSIIKEGGNVFNESNSVVPKELLQTNINFSLKLHGLNDLKYKLVGNINKPLLGDIDIAVDKKELVNRFDISEDNFWEDLNKFLVKFSKASEYKINKGLKQFHLLSPLVDKSGKQISAIDKNGKTLEEPGKIQIDVFVGNLNWMSDVISGAPLESKYKAVYRNLLLNAAFAVIKWPSKKNPSVYNKLTMDGREGFKMVQKQITKNKDKKIKERQFTVDPDVVGHVLFNKSIKWKDINSFEKLWDLFISDKFRFKSLRNDIIQEFKKTLIRNKKKLPVELE